MRIADDSGAHLKLNGINRLLANALLGARANGDDLARKDSGRNDELSHATLPSQNGRYGPQPSP